MYAFIMKNIYNKNILSNVFPFPFPFLVVAFFIFVDQHGRELHLLICF